MKMVMRKVMWIIREAKRTLQTKGMLPFLRFLASFVFQHGTFYLYEYTMKERKEADFMPKIRNFTFKEVSTTQQYDGLVAEGFQFNPDVSSTARQWLDKGTIAFCIFVGGELAHIGWVALTEEAKNTFDPIPYRVNFADKEACTGGTWTNPEYRGTGLMVYGYFKRFQFLRKRGITKSRNIVGIGNIASQKGHAQFSPKICGQARYLKLFWWTFWKETL